MAREAFYITTPIYYPNDRPHIGHAYTTVLADVLARWNRLLGKDVFFLTGTDEHGLKLQRTAEKHGVSPKEFVDKMSAIFKSYWEKLQISYNRFIRTTDPDHVETVKLALSKIYSKGLIYKGVYKGWYCTSCEKFYSEGEYIEKDGVKLCPLHLKPLEWVEEESYFLKLSEYEDTVVRALESGIVYPPQYAREVLGRIRKEGLRDVSITRPKERVYWGIEAPWDKSHTIYVWVDALLNYLTAIGYGRDEDRFKRYWSVVHHVIGKDILWFHTALWFAILAMLELPPPRRLLVHGFILCRGVKMSKTIGNIVSIDDLLETYGSSDAVRYLLARFSTFEKDMDYDPDLFRNAYNAELADTYGNLVRRVGVLVRRKLGGVLRRREVDEELARVADEVKHDTMKLMDRYRVSEALVRIFDLLREANAYLNRKEPWRAEDPEPILYNAMEAVRVATNMLAAFMPSTAARLADVYGFRLLGLEELVFGSWESYRVKEAPILFKKLRA